MTKPETLALTTHFDKLAAQAKEAALRDVRKLRMRLAELEVAIETDMQPAASIGGDLGLIGTAAEAQRHTDAWLSAAQSVRVVRFVQEGL